MHGRGELKSFMHNELEIMNQLNSHKIIRIHDAFETLTNVTLIIELYPFYIVYLLCVLCILCFDEVLAYR